MSQRLAVRLALALPPLLILVILVILVILAGCSSANAYPAGGIPTATGTDLRLSTNRASYSTHTPIGVILVNGGKSDYYGIDGRSDCTLIQVQRYDGDAGTWVSVDGCTPSTQSRVLLIRAGARESFTLAPHSTSDANAWDSSIYRIAIAYSSNSDGVTGERIAYSAGFVIQG